MTAAQPTTDPSELEPIMVFAEMPRCPNCDGFRLLVTKTYPRESDGSLTQRRKCTSCGRRILLILE